MATLNNRKVIEIEIDGVDFNDAPDFCDAYVYQAVFEDTGESLSEEQMDQLVSENYDEILELIWESR
jgi:hypothetical protein